MPLRCANQSYSYYERDEDLDLDAKINFAYSRMFLRNLGLVGVIRPFASEKVDNLGVPF